MKFGRFFELRWCAVSSATTVDDSQQHLFRRLSTQIQHTHTRTRSTPGDGLDDGDSAKLAMQEIHERGRPLCPHLEQLAQKRPTFREQQQRGQRLRVARISKSAAANREQGGRLHWRVACGVGSSLRQKHKTKRGGVILLYQMI